MEEKLDMQLGSYSQGAAEDNFDRNLMRQLRQKIKIEADTIAEDFSVKIFKEKVIEKTIVAQLEKDGNLLNQMLSSAPIDDDQDDILKSFDLPAPQFNLCGEDRISEVSERSSKLSD